MRNNKPQCPSTPSPPPLFLPPSIALSIPHSLSRSLPSKFIQGPPVFISMFDNDVIVQAIPALQGPDYCVGLVLTQQVQALLSERHTVCQQPAAAVLLRGTTYPLCLSLTQTHTIHTIVHSFQNCLTVRIKYMRNILMLNIQQKLDELHFSAFPFPKLDLSYSNQCANVNVSVL